MFSKKEKLIEEGVKRLKREVNIQKSIKKLEESLEAIRAEWIRGVRKDYIKGLRKIEYDN